MTRLPRECNQTGCDQPGVIRCGAFWMCEEHDDNDMSKRAYVPPVEAIEWYRERFDLRLSEIEISMEHRKDTMTESEYAAATNVFRIIRYTLLPQTDGCIVTMFDPRMHMLQPMPKPAEIDTIVADPLRGNCERGHG